MARSFLSRLTSILYKGARLSNKARIIDEAAHGNLRPTEKYFKNRLLFKIFGRFLR